MAMIHMEPQTLQLFERVLGTLKPPPNLTLSQWADKYRRLSAEASSAKGQWNTDNAPFQREIMDAIGDVHIRKVVAMMCAQAGKTEGLILNTVGFYMSYYPAPIMIVQPTVNLGESFSKDRLATMIRDTPILRGLVDNKSRYSGNTITKKNFPGGQLTIIGANSPTDLRGRPIKVLLADEVDAYKASAGKEGDPIMLAEERQTTYWDHKTVLVSTPTTKASSRILDEFNASTQEEWNIPCPNCGKYQPFVWDMFLCIRRFFNYAWTSFVLDNMSKLDKPMNPKRLQSIIDSENMKGSKYVSEEACASYRMVADTEKNTAAELVAGHYHFYLYCTPFPPLKQVNVTMEYEASSLVTALNL